MKGHYFLFLVSFSLMMMFVACDNGDNEIQETCNDNILNQGETLVDCGGPCPPCVPTCDNGIQDIDPGSGWIEEGVDCGGPCESCCGNGVMDALETWVDCGGPECEPCEQCYNGVQDGAEIGIDCDDDDFTECPPCSQLCNDGLLNGNEDCTDCGGACFPCDNSFCFNGELDDDFESDELNETGIDCGGCMCPPCASLCSDGILNGNEVAIDCGGDDCPPCDEQCMDGIMNGIETGIDCDDVPTNNCPSCISLCGNGNFDGQETNLDCGGVCSPCGTINIYLVYDVTYNPGMGTEQTLYYESISTEIIGAWGYSAADQINMIAATMNFAGGTNPLLEFNSVSAPKDSDIGTGALDFEEGVYTMNNVNISLGDADEVIFTPPDGSATYSSINPNGITLDITTFEYTPLPFETVNIEATFSGDLYDIVNDKWIIISNGEFKFDYQF